MSSTEVDEILAQALSRIRVHDDAGLAALIQDHPEQAGEIARLREVMRLVDPDAPATPNTGDRSAVRELKEFHMPLPVRPSPGRLAAAQQAEGGVAIRLESGQQLGKYSLQRELGRGGMGVVWLARDSELGIQVALKFLSDVLTHDEESMRQLRREARNMLALTHEHIVRCYTLERVGSIAFLVMEYLRGPTLAEVLKERQRGRMQGMDSREVLIVLEQVAAAIDHAHKHGCLHLDLKPGNLMLTRVPGDLLASGRAVIKVADFGLSFRTRAPSSVSDATSNAFRRGGTLQYVSPEVLRNEMPTEASDVYSLGATLYHLVSGQPPFLGPNLVDAVLHDPPPRLAGESSSLNDVILRCLEKDPSARPASASAVLQGALYLRPREIAPSVRPGIRGRLASAFLAPKGKLPADFEAIDARAGSGGWARVVRDQRTGIQFKLVEPGEYQRGSSDETGAAPEHPRHRVEFTQPFYLAVHVVTVGQWRGFARLTQHHTGAERTGIGVTLSPDGSWGVHSKATWKNPFPLLSIDDWGDDHPVTMVSWLDVQEFCSPFGYRLPTEAEWEYACRAGTESAYWWGDRPDRGLGCGNFCDVLFREKFPESRAAKAQVEAAAFDFDDGALYTSAVGRFRPNPWGFQDMLGNVWEWCQDAFDPGCYQEKVRLAPMGMSGKCRPLRGGSYADAPDACRSAFRHRAPPDHASARIGFRPLVQL